jgi:hypothetical protein
MEDKSKGNRLMIFDDFEIEIDLGSKKNPKQTNVSDMHRRSILRGEKRKHPRVILDLPLEYHALGIPSVYGAIIVNGAEEGFLIRALQDMRLGTRLNVSILFPNGFELATFEALAQIVRKGLSEKRDEGYKYGVKIVHINEFDRFKLRYILSPQPPDQTS